MTSTVAAAAANRRPTVAKPIRDQALDDAEKWSFALPKGTFADADGDKLTYAAKLASGGSLPNWLQFDAKTATFDGKPPAAWSGPLDIAVTASDGKASVGDTFRIAEKPEFSGTFSTPTWGKSAINFTYDDLYFGVEKTWDESVSAGPFTGWVEAGAKAEAGLRFEFNLESSRTSGLLEFDAYESFSKLDDVIDKAPWMRVDTRFTGKAEATIRGGDISENFIDIFIGAKAEAWVKAGFEIDTGVIGTVGASVGLSTSDLYPETKRASIDLHITADDDFSIGGDYGSITGSLPKPVTGSEMRETRGRAALVAEGVADPFITASLDIGGLLAEAVPELAPLFGFQESIYDDGTSVRAGISVQPVSLTLDGTFALKERTTITAGTAITAVTSYGETVKGKEGDTLSFDTPEGEGTFDVKATYVPQVVITSEIMLRAQADFVVSLFKVGLYLETGVGNTDDDLFTAFEHAIPVTGIDLPIETIVERQNLAGAAPEVENFTIAYEKFRTTQGSGDNWSLTTHQIIATGNDNANRFVGNDLGNRMDGGKGDDNLIGADGNDELIGGRGNDTLRGDDGVDVLDGGDGNDKIRGGKGDDKLIGGAGKNVLTDTEGNNIFDATLGQDTIVSGKGDDTIYYGRANDTYVSGGGKDLVFGGFGNDTLTGAYIAFGQGGNDKFTGSKVQDVVAGGLDDDRLSGGGGDDILGGDAGKDVIVGGDGNDFITGGFGDDVIAGGAGNDILFGKYFIGPQAIKATGRSFAEWSPEPPIGLQSDVDTFVFTPGGGVDYLADFNPVVDARQTYEDRIDLTAYTNIWSMDDIVIGTVDFDDYANQGIRSTLGDQPIGVRSALLLGGGDAILFSISARQQLGAGSILFYDGRGKDTRTGTDGNDTMFAGADADRMIGLKGDDTYLVENVGDACVEQANEGFDTVQSSVSYTLAANVERLILTGTEKLNGAGSGGDNILIGNDAANRLNGGAGDDVMDGLGGIDILTGGAGRDRFVLGELTAAGDVAAEQIADFNVADDQILLNASVLTSVRGAIDFQGHLLAGQFGIKGVDEPFYKTILYDKATGEIFYSGAIPNQVGWGVHVIGTVKPGTELTFADFEAFVRSTSGAPAAGDDHLALPVFAAAPDPGATGDAVAKAALVAAFVAPEIADIGFALDRLPIDFFPVMLARGPDAPLHVCLV